MRIVNIKDFGWSFQLPSKTRFADSSFDTKGIYFNRFKKIGSQEIISLFTINEGSEARFESVAIKDTNDLENWKTKCAADNRWYFEQISLLSGIKIIDTSYLDETIGGKSFKKEYIKTFHPRTNDTTWEYHFFGKFKAHELSINIIFSDTVIGKMYIDILRSSKFKW